MDTKGLHRPGHRGVVVLDDSVRTSLRDNDVSKVQDRREELENASLLLRADADDPQRIAHDAELVAVAQLGIRRPALVEIMELTEVRAEPQFLQIAGGEALTQLVENVVVSLSVRLVGNTRAFQQVRANSRADNLPSGVE